MTSCSVCNKILTKKAKSEKVISQGEAFCKKCYKQVRSVIAAKTRRRQGNDHQPFIEHMDCEPESIEVLYEKKSETNISLPIKRTITSGSQCIFRCQEMKNSMIISDPARAQIFNETGIYATKTSRCCSHHYNENGLLLEIEIRSLVPESESSSFTPNELTSFLNSLRKPAQNFLSESYFDEIDEVILKNQTGLSREYFEALHSHTSIKSKRRSSLALGIYLWKLRSGHTDEMLSNLFDIPRSTIERYCNKIRNELTQNFVPSYLGFENLNREILKENQTSLAKKLFLNDNHDSVASIWDGTYIYIQKSSNYSFQRVSYSMHKSRNLVKPMMAVTTNGLIIDAIGPYPANRSDAEIMNDIMEYDSFKRLFEPNDVFIVDRGFRDSLSKLEAGGYVAHMPIFQDRDKKQLTTEQANLTRKTTKVRYIVEVVNGKIKKGFRYFDIVWSNLAVPHLMEDFRIACAIYNAFHSRLDSDRSYVEEIYVGMNDRNSLHNTMEFIAEDYHLIRKRSVFELMTSESLPDFPKLTWTDLYRISLGTYQIKQAISYYAEHLNKDGKYEFQIYTETESIDFEKYNLHFDDPLLIKVRIESRHSKATKYFLFILIEKSRNMNEEGEDLDIDSDKNTRNEQTEHLNRGFEVSNLYYYCQCKNGARTVGCCAHVMSVLWYLGYARYLPDIKTPAKFLNEVS